MDIKNNFFNSLRDEGFSNAEITSALNHKAKMRAEEQSFKSNFEKNWKPAFLASECFYIEINETVKTYIKHVQEIKAEDKTAKDNTYTALSQIYRRASQQYLEIITLVKNGFPDGAFARWRSMYELSVIGAFIQKYGEAVAEKFIEASNSEDRYDWAMASEAFPETKRHVTFGDILKLCDMDFDAWKEQYNAANQTMHASAQGTFGRLGVRDGEKLNSQRSDYGIAAPAIQSANTLALIATMLISLYQDSKTTAKMELALKWLNELNEKYYEIHDTLFPDD